MNRGLAMRTGTHFRRFFNSAPEEPAIPFGEAHEHAPLSGSSDDGLFNGGPPSRLQEIAGLMKSGQPNTSFRAALAVGLGWLPLAAAAAVPSLLLQDGSLTSFASDFGVHARSLIAAPLLIMAEATCLPRLSGVGTHFGAAGTVTPDHQAAFRRI